MNKNGFLNPRIYRTKKNVGTVRYRVISADGKYLDIGHGKPTESGPTYPKEFAARGVPKDGLYRISVK